MTMTTNTSPWEGKLYANGWVTPEGGTYAVKEPATGAELIRVGVASPNDINRAANDAAEAQKQWANMPFDRRAHILREAAGLLRKHEDDFNYWNVRECGSILAKAQWELDAAYEQIQMAAAMPMQSNGMLFPSALPGRSNSWQQVPIGVVGVISPWNFPLLLAMRSVAPALAVGNSVVLKPDDKAAICGGLLIAQIFHEAGLPEGVLQVLPGGADAGEALVSHPKVGIISFTGSTAVGRKIGATCGRLLKKVALELGGNNAIIIMNDADINAASSNAAWGAFLHQGQICMQAGRHLVHRSIAQTYTDKLAMRAKALVVGNPHTDQVHIGPLINATQRDRVDGIVQAAIADGARLIAGGTFQDLFYSPTVLADVTPDMRAFSEEIFGPVAPITVFDTVDEAITLVNSSEYGLAAAIHTSSTGLGLSIARQLKCGMVHINDQTVNNEFQVPFGGMGASGNGGRFGGPANAHEFTQSQWISTMEQPIVYPF